jgi:hypothetical protein
MSLPPGHWTAPFDAPRIQLGGAPAWQRPPRLRRCLRNRSANALIPARNGLFFHGGKKGRPGWFWRSPEGRLKPLTFDAAAFRRSRPRHVPVIATPASSGACGQSRNLAIPIVFGANDDPVKLVVSLAWPGSNATGINRPEVGLQASSLPAVGA